MNHIADRLDAAAAELTVLERSISENQVPAASFAATSEGLPGRLGRRLHAHWSAVLAARTREAADTAQILTTLAADVRQTARDYTDTDAGVADRLRREP